MADSTTSAYACQLRLASPVLARIPPVSPYPAPSYRRSTAVLWAGEWMPAWIAATWSGLASPVAATYAYACRASTGR